MSLRKQLQAMMELIMSGLPDEESTEVEVADPGPGETEPDTNAAKGEKSTEPSTVENTEFQGATEPPNEIIVTADQATEQSLDMRLAGIYQAIEEQGNAIALLLTEVNKLKANFTDINDAIDTAAQISPTVENLADLIRQV